MGSLFWIKSAALEAPCTIEQVSRWQKSVARAQSFQPYEYNDCRKISRASSFGFEPMSHGHSNERLSVDDTEKRRRPRSLTPHSGRLSSPSLSLATTAAATLQPENSSTISIGIFSNVIDNYVDVPATFFKDENCNENWISRDLVAKLGLTGFEKFGDDAPDGKLEDGMPFLFDGRISLGWKWKNPHPLSGQMDAADYLVVPEDIGVKCPMVWLKASLSGVPDAELKPVSPIHAPVPNKVMPHFDSSFGAPMEKTPSNAAASISSVDGSKSDSEKDGFIDEGELYSDVSDKAKWADEWMKMFSKNIKDMFEKEREGSMGRVKIAILDTGVDHKHLLIDGAKSGEVPRLIECCSFVGDSDGATDNSRTQDTDGHGTHIAGLIMELAPCAEMYIAKISNDRKVYKEKNRIADAIRWAVKKNVDIISMSFGFPSGLGHDPIRHELEKACSSSKNILLFAAASNKGKEFGATFPASDPSVICIYATDGHGYGSKLNPQIHNRKTRFATLGHAVKSIKAGTTAGEARGSGTSYATPIAAAIAANILELALRTNMHHKFYSILKSKQGMEKVFSIMVPKDDVNDLDCLILKNLFHRHMRITSIHDVILMTLDP
ncbi:subtilisin-like protein [Hyaloscypha hepaticicola]|uniref:Subtilisin-like protein n=1 Tax=Hyaloscypha hepaticicola TaxID=2082293 RepID=A0A2J6QED5_9HELO|nr:subtilisin-like protein [Hyaloscypha hepaticicola]